MSQMTANNGSETRILLCGCGKMGSALLDGWLESGIGPDRIQIIEPFPSERLLSISNDRGLAVNPPVIRNPSVCVIAVKPQTMDPVLENLAGLDLRGTLILSIAAGVRIARFESAFAGGTPVIRAMPNTPAAIGLGITAIIGNGVVDEHHLATATMLLDAVGATVRVRSEDDMDVVTAISGSGPAYVFLLIEALAEAGERRGLSEQMSLDLALLTVFGAATLASGAERTPEQLRNDVTSPNGTTAAALDVLLEEGSGLPALMERAVEAAEARSRELGG